MAEKKDLSMEVRLLIAFALAGLILFAQQYFYKPAPPAQSAVKDLPAEKTSSAIPIPAAAPQTSPSAAPVPGQIQAGQEQVFAIDTKLYHVEFSNRGAVVRRWLLKAYKDHDFNAAKAKPVDLVNPLSLTHVPAPFSAHLQRGRGSWHRR